MIKAICLFQHEQILGNPVRVQVIAAGHAAGHSGLEVRVLAAENGVQLGRLDLVSQGVQIVLGRHQVGFGRQLVRGVPPIGVGERPELAAVDKGGQFVLDGREVIDALPGSVAYRTGQVSGFLRIGLGGADNVNPIQGVQMIEVHHMVVNMPARPSSGCV